MTTPGQTVGPFFAFGLEYDGDSALVPPGSPGAIRLHGRVLDGGGEPVPDALVELWQADADGLVVQRSGSLRRDGYTFTGWGRAGTDRTGTYSFTTLTPGVTRPGAAQPDRPGTRRSSRSPCSPAGCSTGSSPGPTSPVTPTTGCSPHWTTTDGRRCVAAADDHGFVFDIRLQGEGETVFLSYPGTPD